MVDGLPEEARRLLWRYCCAALLGGAYLLLQGRLLLRLLTAATSWCSVQGSLSCVFRCGVQFPSGW